MTQARTVSKHALHPNQNFWKRENLKNLKWPTWDERLRSFPLVTDGYQKKEYYPSFLFYHSKRMLSARRRREKKPYHLHLTCRRLIGVPCLNFSQHLGGPDPNFFGGLALKYWGGPGPPCPPPLTIILKCDLFWIPSIYELNSIKKACNCVLPSKPKPISIVFIWLREGPLWPTSVHGQGPQLLVGKFHSHAPLVHAKKYYCAAAFVLRLIVKSI